MFKRRVKHTSTEQLEAVLDQLDPNCSYPEWINVLMAVCHETGKSEDGFQLIDTWSSRSFKYPGTEKVRMAWKYLDPGRNRPITIGTLYWMAKQSR